ncbi:TetR/AcrR family transcriptional regulator [Sinomonas sp. ASV322]|uniref:TetR/AcrR family transcriptional regulator n=1 Tax=Sinomonas sp. ASV322 TaxID=3041920 RepID=UPI0027DD3E89|nr:TetR/AcrR family transcriptional regulator [Sinomonas sp. ASV322]MDQ4502953.1 TetR/AcrR family transcriptional regulator [Sinomonas sp. ASV322]
MPRIQAESNAAQRALTQRRILDAFGELLFTRGLPGLTMTDVARQAGIGRTAVYNYYADLEELLIGYALDETGRFLTELKDQLAAARNPVDKLAIYVRAQVEDLSRRHLPPGPAMRAVLSPSSFAKLGDHVGELNAVLRDILRECMDEGYIPRADLEELAQLVLGSLAASANRGQKDGEVDASPSSDPMGEPTSPDRHTDATVRFIQLGVGARFDDDRRPVRA